MSTTEIKQLPTAEKLALMEALWTDLTSDSDVYQGPDWHADELKETERRFNASEIKTFGLEEVGKRLTHTPAGRR